MLRKISALLISICCCVCIYAHPNPHAPPSRGDLFSLPFPGDPTKHAMLIPYDAQIYALAYDIFLASGRINEAFTVAAAAVAQLPNDLTWRKRLITVALWNQKPGVALDQYLYLAKNTNDPTLLPQGIKLANSMHLDYPLSALLDLSIARGNHQLTIWNQYLAALLRLGEARHAVTQLTTYQNHLPPSYYFQQKFSLYYDLDDLFGAEQTLRHYAHRIGITPYYAQNQTEIDLTHGALHPAFTALKIAAYQAKPTDVAFWDLYGQIAWFNNNDKAAQYAYLKRVNQPPRQEYIPYIYLRAINPPKPNEDAFIRLIDIYSTQQPYLAYHYAITGRKLYPQNVSLTQNALTLAMLIGQWRRVSSLVNTAPSAVKQQLNQDPNYWSLRANQQRQLDYPENAARYYHTALLRFTDNDSLKSEYIALLIQMGQLGNASQLLPLWQRDICHSPELWNSFASAYSHLANAKMTYAIIGLFYNQASQYQHDPYWLLAFKEALDGAGFTQAARNLSDYIWPVYVNFLLRQSEPPDYQQTLAYAKLATEHAPGDPSARALAVLQHTPTPEFANLVLAWSLDQRIDELAQAAYYYAWLHDWLVDPQSLLTLAINHLDRYTLRTLLQKHAEMLSPQERITAAQMIDAPALAQTLAYRSLATNPHNADIYDRFSQVMLKSAPHLDVTQQYYQYGPIAGPVTKLAVTVLATPGVSMTFYGSLWLLRNLDNTQIGNVPSLDERLGVKTKLTANRGDWLVDIGYRDNLRSFLTANVSRDYQLYDKIKAVVQLGYHQQSDDTAAMLVGGMKNNLLLTLEYNMSAKNSLQGELAQNFFYTQDGAYLAEGQQETLRIRHLFWQKYPDYSVSAYITAAQYGDEASTVSAAAASLVPVGTEPTVSFFVPQSFYEYGINAEFGESYREDYTHNWRPFGGVTVMNNSTAGFGRAYNFGIAGSVFGKDHLAIYYETAINQVAGVSKSQLLEVAYRLYF